ncbi:hypothetical protein BJ912DRAFT_1152160 [Pholiota molesta]|nr:hypothetical protein BJ912DRAFT_1152160 [Pholiota molesta]
MYARPPHVDTITAQRNTQGKNGWATKRRCRTINLRLRLRLPNHHSSSARARTKGRAPSSQASCTCHDDDLKAGARLSTLSTTARRVPLPPSRMWAGARQLRLERHTTTRTAASRQPARATSSPAYDQREHAAHGAPPSNQRSARDSRHTARLGTQSRTTRYRHRERASERRGGGRRGRASEAPRRARSAPTSAAIGHSATPPPAQPYALSPPHSQSAVSTASSYPTSTPTSSRSRSTTTSPTRPSPPHGATPPPPTSTTTPTAASTATATSRRRSSGSCSTFALARPATAGSRARATMGAGWALGRDGKVKERSGRHRSPSVALTHPQRHVTGRHAPAAREGPVRRHRVPAAASARRRMPAAIRPSRDAIFADAAPGAFSSDLHEQGPLEQSLTPRTSAAGATQ